MAKKNRDLFEILGARASDGAGRIAQRVQEIVSPQSSPAKRRKRERKGAPRAASGVVLAAVAFGCLVTGFAVGRFTGPATVQDELNASNRRAEASPVAEARFGVEPGRFGGAPALDDEKLVESLSQFYYVLLPFPIPDGSGGEAAAFEKAARLARWAHGEGFENVRLKRFGESGSNQFWVVVDYVDDPEDTTEYQRLRALQSPDFAPGLGAFVAKRNKPFKSS